MKSRLLSAVLTMLGFGMVAGTLQGQVFVWTGIGDDDIFSTNENWVGLVAPGPTDSVEFGPHGAYTVVRLLDPTTINNITFASTRTATYTITDFSDFATLNLTGGITVDTGPSVYFSSTVTLNLSAGAHTFNLITDGPVLQIEGAVIGTGSLVKTGAGLISLTGTSTYDGGTTVHFGEVELYGGTITHASAHTTVGSALGDNAALSVWNGGILSNLNGLIGHIADSTGLVIVSGTGSAWNNAGELRIADHGDAELYIENGAAVSNTTGYVGANAGSLGEVIVDDTGSTWTNSAELYVGFSGQGYLDITGGGMVTNLTAGLGYFSGAYGAAWVGGTGSTWTTSGFLYVGAEGEGLLDINAGGTATADNISIGNNTGGSGTVIVNGADSTLETTGTLYVGSAGFGILDVRNGGLIASAVGSIGNNSGGDGYVEVEGTGSIWNNTGSLIVGNAGTGELYITDQGQVSTDTASIGAVAGVLGSTTVDVGGVMAVAGDLVVGNSGIGILEVDSGGSAISGGNTIVANNTGSTGVLAVNGALSEVSVGGDLYIGNAGNGTLQLIDSAMATVALSSGTVHLGHSGGVGTLYIGYDGEGYTPGGIVNASQILTNTGTGTVYLGTDSTASSPYHLTNTGTAGGDPVAIEGATSVYQLAGYNMLTAVSGYTGGSVISGGTLVADSSGALGTGTVMLNGGSLELSPGVTLANTVSFTVGGGVLGGNGTLTAPFTAGSNVTLDPGNSVGTLTFEDGLTFGSGGGIDLEVQFATGLAGTGYDLISVSGALLDITATNVSPFSIRLISLDGSGNPGNVGDFSAGSTYAWNFAFSAEGIAGFSADKFVIDTTDFTNVLGGGTFSLTGSASQLTINFTPVPEPSTYALMGTGLVLCLLYHRRRRTRAQRG